MPLNLLPKFQISIESSPRPSDNGPLGKFPHFLADAKENMNATNATEDEIEEYWLDKTFDAREGELHN